MMRRALLAVSGLSALVILMTAPLGIVNAQGLEGCNDDDPNIPCNVIDPACQNSASDVLCPENQKPTTISDNGLFGPNGVFTKATRLVATVVGIAAVIMIIVGGFKYVLASGDSSNITSAKNTILYAIIGLIVALLAQGLITFVLVRL